MGWCLFGLLIFTIVNLAERLLVSISPHEIEEMERSNAPALTLKIAQSVKSALAALLLARLLIKLLIVTSVGLWAIREPSIRALFHQVYIEYGIPNGLSTIVTVAVIGGLSGFIFWNVKRIGFKRLIEGEARHLAWVRRLSPFIRFWQVIFSPFIYQKKEKNTPGNASSREESPAANEKREIELLKSIVRFGDTTVKQIMQPRTAVTGLEESMSFSRVLDVVRRAEFSRLPVYEEEIDNIKGILYVKDLLPHLKAQKGFSWQKLMRPNVLFVPESKLCIELLQEFKKQKLHLAIVVDEFGSVSGIATLEDVLEEVTGDIRDEFDDETTFRFRKVNENTFIFEGQTPLSEVCRIIGIEADTFEEIQGGADTLAGLLLEIHGDIPQQGARIEWNDFLFTVSAADKRRIRQVRLQLPDIHQDDV